jgi:hypothetical protein
MCDVAGGLSFLLGLVVMANDVEFMYAAINALVSTMMSNKESIWKKRAFKWLSSEIF